MGVFGINKQVINKKYHHNYTIGHIDRQKGIHDLRTKIPWTNSCAKKCKTVLFCSITRLCILKSQSQAAPYGDLTKSLVYYFKEGYVTWLTITLNLQKKTALVF